MLKNMINNLIKSDNIWKTKLKKAISFISSKDADEERLIHAKSDNNDKLW